MNRAVKILSDMTGWHVDAILSDGPPIRPSNAMEAMKQIAWEVWLARSKRDGALSEETERVLFEKHYDREVI